jgi:hypothetical protein
MNVWTATPKPVTVSFDSMFNAGIEETLLVAVQRYGLPVESALVCLLCDTLLYETRLTDGDGNADFVFNLPSENSIDITITGRNLVPYEGTVEVVGSGAYVTYLGNSVEDSLGNDNGAVDPGETILLSATLKNCGTEPAQEVTAILRSSDTCVLVSDSCAVYGDLPGGASSCGLYPFVFSVSPHVTAHPIPFEIAITDSAGDVWTSCFSVVTSGVNNGGTATGPDQYGYYLYDDTDTLTGNAPSYSWFEIAPPAGGPGLIIPEITNEDADTVTLPLPFTFKYYGSDYYTVGICSNGFIEIGGANYPFSYNDPIPTLGRARSFAAPYWDDLDPSTQTYGHGDIYRYHDASNHLWIMEFYQVALGYDPYSWQTFQVVLRDPAYYPTPTGDGEILFLYQNISSATSNTVGIEDITETIGVQYVYNDNYEQNAAVLSNGRAILVTTKPPVPQHSPWLQLMSVSVRDSAGGNNNGLPEPYEVIEVVLDMKNSGDAAAAGVWGQLSSGSASAVVLDNNADYGDLVVGGSASNAADPYEIQIGAEPVDTVVGMVVRFVGNNGNYESYSYFTLRIHHEETVAENALAGGQDLRLFVYPNPFRREVQIHYALCTMHYAGKKSKGGNTLCSPLFAPCMKIYDATGRLVKSFALSPPHSMADMPHTLSVVWNGDDDAGRTLPAGIYFIRLESQDIEVIDKVIMLR